MMLCGKLLRSILVFAVACIAQPAYADKESDEHRAAVQEMLLTFRISEDGIFNGLKSGIKSGLKGGVNARATSIRHATCVTDKLDRAFVMEKLLYSYMKYLSTSQARDITHFHKTPAGKKFAQFAADVASGKLSTAPPNSKPPGFSDSDMREFVMFTKNTDGGRRILEIGQTPLIDVITSLDPTIQNLIEECK